MQGRSSVHRDGRTGTIRSAVLSGGALGTARSGRRRALDTALDRAQRRAHVDRPTRRALARRSQLELETHERAFGAHDGAPGATTAIVTVTATFSASEGALPSAGSLGLAAAAAVAVAVVPVG